MVSTRQMCGGAVGGYDETPTSTRASVVRRTTQYQQQQQQEQVASCSAMSEPHVLNLLDLPTELITKTLGYLDYKKVSNLRLVSDQPSAETLGTFSRCFQQ